MARLAPVEPVPGRAEFDRAVATLREHKEGWARLPVREKAAVLGPMRERIAAVAGGWVAAAVRAKGLPPDSPLAGEEWLSGPWALLYALGRYEETLQALARGRTPRLRRGTVRERPGGQVVVEVFPQRLYDRLLLSGVRAEVWMDPEIEAERVLKTMAPFYRQRAPRGGVALVLGAGNIASIGPLDVLHKLLAEGRVCLLKLNPVNAYLGPFLAEIFDPLIEAGWVRIVSGGADVGAYLCAHGGIDEIHITGAAATHDAIVYGGGPEGAARKRRDEPLLDKPVTSELGNVSPTIVMPGPWTRADLRFQAEHIATQKWHNAGFNCIAAQVLITHAGWDQGPDFLDALRATVREIPSREPYYPGAAERLAAIVAAHPEAEPLGGEELGRGAVPRVLVAGVDATRVDDPCFTVEGFGGALAQTSLPGRDAAEFLRGAVRFCNDTLAGTLGANLIVHPVTARELGPVLEEAIAALRYGCVGVNAWTGVGFLLAQTPWGAFPGHTRADVGSGIGHVHNTLLFGRPQKSVVRAPFRPFPRSLAGIARGGFSILPKPPWFITNRRGAELGRRLVAFEANSSPWHLPGIFFAALRG